MSIEDLEIAYSKFEEPNSVSEKFTLVQDFNFQNYNFPLEYQALSLFFDLQEISNETNFVIEKILKKYNIKTVWDLTYGTGSQPIFLKQKGYDISPLLQITREKAYKENLAINFCLGDIKDFKMQGKTFDACITIFNAIGHLTKTDFQKAMLNIYNHLKVGGIYVFDIFNSNALKEEDVQHFAYQSHKIRRNMQALKSQPSIINKENGF